MRLIFGRHGQRGASVISTLIGVGLIGGIAAVGIKMFANAVGVKRKIQLDVDNAGLAQYFLKTTDCEKSLELANCGSGTAKAVALYTHRDDGTYAEILAADGSDNRRGRLLVKAVCDPYDRSIYVLALAAPDDSAFTSTSPADFTPDPLTHVAWTWASPEANILKSRLPVCANPGYPFPLYVHCRLGASLNGSEAIYNLIRVSPTSVSYEGVSSSWLSHITFTLPSGAISSYYHSPCGAKDCTYPASGVLKTKTAAGTKMTMTCPPTLIRDGREIMR